MGAYSRGGPINNLKLFHGAYLRGVFSRGANSMMYNMALGHSEIDTGSIVGDKSKKVGCSSL